MKSNDVRMLSSVILILAAVELAKIRDAGIVGLVLGVCAAYVFVQAYIAQNKQDSNS